MKSFMILESLVFGNYTHGSFVITKRAIISLNRHHPFIGVFAYLDVERWTLKVGVCAYLDVRLFLSEGL
jgi:hypothetical protein